MGTSPAVPGTLHCNVTSTMVSATVTVVMGVYSLHSDFSPKEKEPSFMFVIHMSYNSRKLPIYPLAIGNQIM